MTGALKKFTTTLRQTSLDSDDNKNEYMTESEINVLNFDKIKNCYFGRYLSNNSKSKTTESIKELVKMTPNIAHLKTDSGYKDITIDVMSVIVRPLLLKISYL